MWKSLRFFLVEALIAAVIVGLGWFLIGFYTVGNYLETGYQDWNFHAFRINQIAEYGIVSWNHTWVNGLNLFRGYHFVAHLPAIVLIKLLGLTVNQSMIFVSVSLFIGLRVFTYILLRVYKVRRLFALTGILFSYTHIQTWLTMQDYASFMAGYLAVLLALLIYFYSFKKELYVFVLFAVASLSWSFHPVAGIFVGVLAGIRFLFSSYRHAVKSYVYVALSYLPGVLAYVIPVLHQGIRYDSVYLQSIQFFKMTVSLPYFGLGLPLFILLWACFLASFFYWHQIRNEWKVLLYIAVTFFSIVFVTTLGYLPAFILQFQFGRGLAYVGILLPVCAAGIAQSIAPKRTPFFIATLIVIMMGYLVIDAIDVASSRSGVPLDSLRMKETTDYLLAQKPIGSVYIDNVSRASLLTNGKVRFVTSYNEHLLPSPLSFRIKSLLKDDATYSSLSRKNMDLLSDYATVFGIEYILLRPQSPLEVTLQYDVFSQNTLQVVGQAGDYTVIHNIEPIAYTYLVEQEVAQRLINIRLLEKPTLSVSSYDTWDAEVSTLARAIRDEQFLAQKTTFIQPDQIKVELDGAALRGMRRPVLFSTASYDPNWSVVDNEQITFAPTSTRFMLIQSSSTLPASLVLKNSWPVWYWPLQFLPYLSLGLIFLGIVSRNWLNRKKKVGEEINLHVPLNLVMMARKRHN